MRTCEGAAHPSNPPRSRAREEEQMPKDVRKTLRFSAEEFAQIQAELDRANISFSTFARSAILKKKIKLPIEREYLYELNRIGTNLNQIAKAVNSGERINVLRKLIEIEAQIKALS